MKLYVRDNKSICPSCGGLVAARQNYYSCIDCKAVYIGVEDGLIEGEVVVERVCDGKDRR